MIVNKMNKLLIITFLLLLFDLINNGEGFMCDRTGGITVPKTPGGGKYEIIINGNPGKYVPGAIYTVRLQGQGDAYSSEKFSGFLLVAEPSSGNPGQSGTFRLKDDSLARFSEFCPNAVKHASEIPKSEVQVLWIAPSVTTPSGCVIFRATVMKSLQQWYMDDEGLTKEFCPEDYEIHDENENLEPCTACDEVKYELTFEGLWSSLTHPRNFPDNLWTANFSDIIGASHSPSYYFWDYGKTASEGLRRVAENGDTSRLESELKEESKNIRTIIKARGLRHTNFNGLKTFAVFRADKDHNLVSFVSKIDPSPDWFVGITGLNLCLKNGSWANEREMNLFPIDAGTDSGISYMSTKMRTMPQDKIRRIVWSSDPSSPFYDPDGNMLKPFAKLKIQQQRSYKRGGCENEDENISSGGSLSNDYDIEENYDPSPDRDRPECKMTPWSDWTPCTPNCGEGIKKKFRKYTNEITAREFGCERKDVQEVVCYNSQSCKLSPPPAISSSGGINYEGRWSSGGKLGDEMGEVCGVTEWGRWSLCSDPCGSGVRFRSRSFLRPMAAKRASCDVSKLKTMDQCPRTTECREVVNKIEKGCEMTDWGPWNPCSQTCGKGVKTRYRMYKYPTHDHRNCTLPIQETVPCDGFLPQCPAERSQDDCLEMKHEGECRDSFRRWYFDQVKLRCHSFTYSGCKGTKNVFETKQECEQTCNGLIESGLLSYGSKTRHSRPISDTNLGERTHDNYEHRPQLERLNMPQISSISTYGDSSLIKVDCRVSSWSPWSSCNVSCGRGWKYQRRYIEVFNENGGMPCPTLMERSRRCQGVNCSLRKIGYGQNGHRGNLNKLNREIENDDYD